MSEEIIGTYVKKNENGNRTSFLLKNVKEEKYWNAKEDGEVWVSCFTQQTIMDGVPENGVIQLKMQVYVNAKGDKKYVNLDDKVDCPIEIIQGAISPKEIMPTKEPEVKVTIDDYNLYLTETWENSFELSKKMLEGKATADIDNQVFELAKLVMELQASPFYYFSKDAQEIRR